MLVVNTKKSILLGLISDVNFEEQPIIVTNFSNINQLQRIIDQQFFIVIVDMLDTVVNKQMIKRLKRQFCIGLTSINLFVSCEYNNWIAMCRNECAKVIQFHSDHFYLNTQQ